MLGEKQLKICNFFGVEEQQAKAEEEAMEINEALVIYSRNETMENLKHCLNEVNDLLNVLEGIYVKMGGCLEEIQADKEFSLNRTIQIINAIPKHVKQRDRVAEYEKIRRGYE